VTSADLRRLAIAVACSIAFHEVAVALIPPTATPEPPPHDVVSRVTIVRLTPKPTPLPTPTPTPPPAPHVLARTLAPAGKHARVERKKHVGAHRPTPPKSVHATPDVVPVPTAGTGAGAQRGAGAGSTSTINGTGNGTGATGNGNGAALCGAVDFEASGRAIYDPASGTYQRSNIVATVYYADGSSERIPLDWTWHWKSEADDPFNTSSSAPMLFQFPPAAQRASEPAAIQYIMAHTTPTGRTKLNGQCPDIPPPPSPHGPSATATPESVPL
jgi:hypothetical protein